MIELPADKSVVLDNMHTRRIVHLIKRDLQDAYFEDVEVGVTEDGPTIERHFVVPTREEFDARITAWRSAGLDLRYENFDPATGSVDVYFAPERFRPVQHIKLSVRITLTGTTFEELLRDA